MRATEIMLLVLVLFQLCIQLLLPIMCEKCPSALAVMADSFLWKHAVFPAVNINVIMKLLFFSVAVKE